jgi:hypothetical protein
LLVTQNGLRPPGSSVGGPTHRFSLAASSLLANVNDESGNGQLDKVSYSKAGFHLSERACDKGERAVLGMLPVVMCSSLRGRPINR